MMGGVITYEYAKLQKLRKSLVLLQQEFIDYLCNDGTKDATKLEKNFQLLFYEIDKLCREIDKE